MNMWNFIENKLNEQELIYLMVVIESKGSSPGKQGFSMAVCSDGSLSGSIGGGIMEYNLVEECREMFSKNYMELFIKKQVHKDSANEGSGMICSGEQTVAFVPFANSDLKNVVQITSCLNNKKTGIIELSESGYNFSLTEEVNETQYDCSITSENSWKFSEVIGYRNTIYIIGAGHVGYAVSRLFSQLGFNVVLSDNRYDLSMLTDNPHADKKLVVDYNEVGKYISEGNNNYIVIMTNNHSNDEKVLSKVIRKKVAYLGLMGSSKKVVGIKKSMMDHGFKEEEFNHLHSPIGISINSITPTEIAVSIAAEIIKVKNGG